MCLYHFGHRKSPDITNLFDVEIYYCQCVYQDGTTEIHINSICTFNNSSLKAIHSGMT